MSPASITLLGAIAGGTIVLGLPVARIKSPSVKLRAFLNATATGVLLFLLWDVLSHAVDPVETALVDAHSGAAGWLSFVRLATVMAGGLVLGLMSLAYYERWMGARPQQASQSRGPGAMAVAERPHGLGLTTTPARRLALLIAVGIGLHNFSEGLAIGQSAKQGAISLAVLLVIGFGLHNATEGFGITAPLTSEEQRPSWPLLLVLGLIGGGPTFLGTVLGQSVASDDLYIAFLALAAGSILYVIVQLIGVALKMGQKELFYWGVLLGLFAGFATDFVVTVAGV
jgi:ZIP family zinc transporter